MKKYIILLVCTLYYLEAMDGPPIKPIKTVIWNSDLYNHNCYSPCDVALLDIIQQHQRAFIGSTVLPYDGYEAIPKLIAQTAQIVHVDATHLLDLETEQEYHHARIKYTIPQPNTYDFIVICNPENLKKDTIRENFRTCYTLLKSSGKLVSVLRLQTDTCILQRAFDLLYPTIRSTIIDNKHQHLKLYLPRKQNFKTYLFSYDELINTCKIDNLFSQEELGNNRLYLFELESYQPKIYNIVIKDQDTYLEWLNLVFNVSTQDWFASLRDGNNKDCKPSRKIMKSLRRQFIMLVIQQLTRDNEGNLLHPLTMTELIWRKWILPVYKKSKPTRPTKSKGSSSWPLERQSKNYEK